MRLLSFLSHPNPGANYDSIGIIAQRAPKSNGVFVQTCGILWAARHSTCGILRLYGIFGLQTGAGAKKVLVIS